MKSFYGHKWGTCESQHIWENEAEQGLKRQRKLSSADIVQSLYQTIHGNNPVPWTFQFCNLLNFFLIKSFWVGFSVICSQKNSEQYTVRLVFKYFQPKVLRLLYSLLCAGIGADCSAWSLTLVSPWTLNWQLLTGLDFGISSWECLILIPQSHSLPAMLNPQSPTPSQARVRLLISNWALQSSY